MEHGAHFHILPVARFRRQWCHLFRWVDPPNDPDLGQERQAWVFSEGPWAHPQVRERQFKMCSHCHSGAVHRSPNNPVCLVPKQPSGTTSLFACPVPSPRGQPPFSQSRKSIGFRTKRTVFTSESATGKLWDLEQDLDVLWAQVHVSVKGGFLLLNRLPLLGQPWDEGLRTPMDWLTFPSLESQSALRNLPWPPCPQLLTLEITVELHRLEFKCPAVHACFPEWPLL